MTAGAEALRQPGPLSLRLAYPLFRAVLAARGLSERPTPPAILVYQMAKVGSTTVVHSIRRSMPGCPVFHIHTLTPEGMESLAAFYRQARVPALPWAGHLLASRFLMEQLGRGVTPGRWKVVTLVRDPIARNLSLIFQLADRLIPGFATLCADRKLDPLDVFRRFESRFPGQVQCMRWFDEELRRVFDVDPFAVPFDRARGFQQYRGPLADVLLIRTDRLNEAGPRALGTFLGLKNVRLRRRNSGLGGLHGRRYAEMLEGITLPRDYVDNVYESAHVRHFFTARELEAMRTRWCGEREGLP